MRFELPSDSRKQFGRKAMICVLDPDVPLLKLFEAVKVDWSGEPVFTSAFAKTKGIILPYQMR